MEGKHVKIVFKTGRELEFHFKTARIIEDQGPPVVLYEAVDGRKILVPVSGVEYKVVTEEEA